MNEAEILWMSRWRQHGKKRVKFYFYFLTNNSGANNLLSKQYTCKKNLTIQSIKYFIAKKKLTFLHQNCW